MTEVSAAHRPEVVISYARQDGREIAEQLEAKLADHGFATWRDLSNMVIGDEWWRQLRERIESAHAVVVVVTAGALASPIVRREIGVTRRTGVPLLPVCPDVTVLKGAPRWLNDLHVTGITNASIDAASWPDDNLLAQLRNPPPRRPVVAMVPPLPEHHVSRCALRDAIKHRLLDANGDGIATTIALIGAGGFGKTTLAQEVCFDEEVIAGYPAGIAWVTVGNEPGRLTAILSELVSQLVAEPVQFITTDQALRRLAEILAERRCLLVLDDVWNPVIVDALRRGLAGILITSREPEVAARDPRGAIPVERLTTDEARELFLSDAEFGDVAADLSHKLDRLLAMLDGWPLVVTLAAKAIRRRIATLQLPVEEAVDWYYEGFRHRGPTVGDSRRSNDRQQSIHASVELSLDLFPKSARQRLLELAALPGGISMPLHAVERLWQATAQMNAEDCKDLLAELSGHFLRMVRTDPTGLTTIVVHDVMRSYLGGLLGVDGLRGVHECLLQSLGDVQASWSQRVSDRYTAATLSHHLLGSGRGPELVALLTADASWLQRTIELTGSPASFVGDIERAVADASIATDLVVLAKLHAAAIAAHALATATIDAALAVLVRLGDDERALSLARLRGSPRERYDALRAIIDAAPVGWASQRDVIDAMERHALAIADQRHACDALGDLVDRLLARGELMRAERIARRAPLDWSRDALLTRVIDAHLAQAAVEEASRILTDVAGFRARSEALCAVAVALERTGRASDTLFNEAFALLEGFGSYKDRAIAATSRRLGRSGLVERFPALLKHLQSDGYQALALVEGACGLVERGNRVDAARLLVDAERLIAPSDDWLSKSTVFSTAAPIWAQLGDISTAKRLVKATPHPQLTARHVAIKLAEAGQLGLAEELASTLKPRQGREEERHEVLLAILRARVRAGATEEARALAEQLFDPLQPRTAVLIVSALAPADPARAALFAEQIEDREQRGHARLAVAAVLQLNARDTMRTLLTSALDDIGDHSARPGLDQALGALAATVAATGDVAAARRLVLMTTDDRQTMGPNPRAVALRRAAVALASAGHMDLAEQLTHDAPTAHERAVIERELIPVLAREHLDAAIEKAVRVEELYRHWPLMQVLDEVVRVRGAQEALALWKRHASTKYPGAEGDVRAHLAATLAQAGDIDGALMFVAPVIDALAGKDDRLACSPAVDFGLAKLAVLVYRAGRTANAMTLARLADRRPLFQDEWQATLLAGTGQVDELGRRLEGSNDLVQIATLWCAAGCALDEAGFAAEADLAFRRAEEPAVRSGSGEDVLGHGRSEEGKRAPLLALGAARTRRGQWRDAYRLLGVTTPGEFVEQVSEWIMQCSDLDAERTRAAVFDVLDVMSWTGRTWTEVRRVASTTA